MRKTLLCLASVAFAAPVATPALADGFLLPGNFSVYYSYADQKVDESVKTPSGSGIGIAGELGLPLNLNPLSLFVDGMYQYNDESYAEFQGGGSPGSTTVGLGLSEQARAGGGVQFAVPTAPVLLYGKIDYVHYRYDSPVLFDKFGDRYRIHEDDDGAGYFGGIRARLPGVELYGEGGYLNLTGTDGEEFTGGVAVPLGPVIRRHAFVQLFAEYQWTRLHENDTAYHDIYHDFRAGLRFPFL